MTALLGMMWIQTAAWWVCWVQTLGDLAPMHLARGRSHLDKDSKAAHTCTNEEQEHCAEVEEPLDVLDHPAAAQHTTAFVTGLR